MGLAIAAATAPPRPDDPLPNETAMTRTDKEGRDVTDLPGLWDEDDITDTCPHCDGGLIEADIHRGQCPHCQLKL